MTATFAERWAAARLRLAQAARNAGLDAQITAVSDHDCRVIFRKSGLEWKTPDPVDIAVFEDRPSPKLDALLAQAQKALTP